MSDSEGDSPKRPEKKADKRPLSLDSDSDDDGVVALSRRAGAASVAHSKETLLKRREQDEAKATEEATAKARAKSLGLGGTPSSPVPAAEKREPSSPVKQKKKPAQLRRISVDSDEEKPAAASPKKKGHNLDSARGCSHEECDEFEDCQWTTKLSKGEGKSAKPEVSAPPPKKQKLETVDEEKASSGSRKRKREEPEEVSGDDTDVDASESDEEEDDASDSEAARSGDDEDEPRPKKRQRVSKEDDVSTAKAKSKSKSKAKGTNEREGALDGETEYETLRRQIRERAAAAGDGKKDDKPAKQKRKPVPASPPAAAKPKKSEGPVHKGKPTEPKKQSSSSSDTGAKKNTGDEKSKVAAVPSPADAAEAKKWRRQVAAGFSDMWTKFTNFHLAECDDAQLLKMLCRMKQIWTAVNGAGDSQALENKDTMRAAEKLEQVTTALHQEDRKKNLRSLEEKGQAGSAEMRTALQRLITDVDKGRTKLDLSALTDALSVIIADKLKAERSLESDLFMSDWWGIMMVTVPELQKALDKKLDNVFAATSTAKSNSSTKKKKDEDDEDEEDNGKKKKSKAALIEVDD